MDGSRWTRGAMDMAVLYDTYLGIDLAGTGRYLEELIGKSGFSVKGIQNILHLSCPQEICFFEVAFCSERIDAYRRQISCAA